jgi:lipoyl-dependent peroxiredoxin
MNISRTGSASWTGDFKNGKGSISTESGALNGYPYAVASRFDNQVGSNPEELLGAAHAACFTMALAHLLGDANLIAERLDTSARVSLTKGTDSYAITVVHLTLVAKIPGADPERFDLMAAKAKGSCPVSKLFNAAITLNAILVS